MSSASSAAGSAPRWICPGCEASPLIEPGADPVCPECKTRLVQLNFQKEDDLVGQVIDERFEIRSFLGQGGMGTVYRAWQRSIGREVAIKMIDKRHGSDEMAVRRFLREARLASQLSQPNTVSIFDVGQSKDGRLFLAMELIRGRTLEEVVAADGAFTPQRAAHVGTQLCDALDAAGRLQIVHRDLKPANVIVLDDPPGRDLIKVLDFGLAKSLTGEESGATQSGLIVGTPRYMAPEVLMGAAHTAASDLYAVGVILGEIVTGSLMWNTSSFAVLLANKVDGSSLTSEIPPGLRSIVVRLIAADPARRYVSPMELRDALLPIVEGRQPDPGGATVELQAIAAPARPSKQGMPKVSFRAAPAREATPAPRGAAESAVATRRDRPAVTPPEQPSLPATAAVAASGSGTAAAMTATTTALRPPRWWRRRVVLLGGGGGVLALVATLVLVLALRGGRRLFAPVAADDPDDEVYEVVDDGLDPADDPAEVEGDDLADDGVHGADARPEPPGEVTFTVIDPVASDAAVRTSVDAGAAADAGVAPPPP